MGDARRLRAVIVRAGSSNTGRNGQSTPPATEGDVAEGEESTLSLANLAYSAGATTNLEVIDAERRARDAETQAVIAEDNARQARLDPLSASGRFP